MLAAIRVKSTFFSRGAAPVLVSLPPSGTGVRGRARQDRPGLLEEDVDPLGAITLARAVRAHVSALNFAYVGACVVVPAQNEAERQAGIAIRPNSQCLGACLLALGHPGGRCWSQAVRALGVRRAAVYANGGTGGSRPHSSGGPRGADTVPRDRTLRTQASRNMIFQCILFECGISTERPESPGCTGDGYRGKGRTIEPDPGPPASSGGNNLGREVPRSVSGFETFATAC